MIYTVLRQRHLKEAIHLEDQLARELEAARRRARAEIEENRQKEREKLLAAFEQVILWHKAPRSIYVFILIFFPQMIAFFLTIAGDARLDSWFWKHGSSRAGQTKGATQAEAAGKGTVFFSITLFMSYLSPTLSISQLTCDSFSLTARTEWLWWPHYTTVGESRTGSESTTGDSADTPTTEPQGETAAGTGRRHEDVLSCWGA